MANFKLAKSEKMPTFDACYGPRLGLDNETHSRLKEVSKKTGLPLYVIGIKAINYALDHLKLYEI